MPKPRQPRARYWNLATDFGWLLLSGVLIFGGVGYWLDGRLDTANPWFTITGILLGLAVAFQSLFRRLAQAEQDEKLEKARQSRADAGKQDTPE